MTKGVHSCAHPNYPEIFGNRRNVLVLTLFALHSASVVRQQQKTQSFVFTY